MFGIESTNPFLIIPLITTIELTRKGSVPLLPLSGGVSTLKHLDELLAQSGLFGDNDPEAEALARFIAANNRSAKRMTLAFKAMAEAINIELLHQGQALGDMFGGGGASLIDILGRVNQELENEGVQTGFMFESSVQQDELANASRHAIK
ncbi:hypothetical protein ACQZN4_003295 [Vibrio alginolyticus]